MAKIETLVEDIQTLLVEGVSEPDTELCDKYGAMFSKLLQERMKREERKGTLRMSNAGKPCERQLYYEVNSPEEGEQYTYDLYAKFFFGDMIELFLLFLSEAAGHKVEGTQDTQEIEGILGHRDAVIDGMVVDAKSASSFAFKKFANGTLASDDAFGYIDQLGGYRHAGKDDPIVTIKDRAGFLVMDKVLGKICLDIHKDTGKDYSTFMKHKKDVVNGSTVPERGFEPIPEGASGNKKLGVNCSYCSFKEKCHPELRTFAYSYGPVYLTTVAREPKVPEIKALEGLPDEVFAD